MATKVKRAYVARGARPANILAKLDKMIALLGTEQRWTKGIMSTHAQDARTGLFARDKNGKIIMAYCLVGAGHAAGNGTQLWYELCYTIEAPKIAEVIPDSLRPFGGDAYLRDIIVGYNDRPSTQYTDIKKVLRVTRDRVRKYGLGHFPKLTSLLKFAA